MRSGVRFGLGVAAFALVGTFVAAAVRENFAEAEFERCVERWTPSVPSRAESELARELVVLDRELERRVPNLDFGVFAPYRWSGEGRAELEVALDDVAPLTARMETLLESDAALAVVARGRGLLPIPGLRVGLVWANVLAARAVLAPDDASAARWLALALDLNRLRCRSSNHGIMLRASFDSIALYALRERLGRSDARADAYLARLDERLRRNEAPVPWSEIGKAEAELCAQYAAPLASEVGATPFDWWQRAETLDALTASIREHEALASGAAPRTSSEMPDRWLGIFERVQHESGERAALARVVLRVMAYRDRCAGWPASVAELADVRVDPADIRFRTTRESARLELLSQPLCNVADWTVPSR